jgi:hypothetical protein
MPISLPVWYVVLDRQIYIGTRGKKVSRVRRDGRASFLVEGGVRWAELWGVHVTGRASVMEPEPDLAQRIAAEDDRKYAQFRTPREEMPPPVRDHYATAARAMIHLDPDARLLTWNNAKLFS